MILAFKSRVLFKDRSVLLPSVQNFLLICILVKRMEAEKPSGFRLILKSFSLAYKWAPRCETLPMSYYVVLLWMTLFLASIPHWELFIYLFLEGGKGGRNRDKLNMREKHRSISSWRPIPQPRYVPWRRIKPQPADFCFAGWRPTHWATPIRALFFSYFHSIIFSLTSRMGLIICFK